MAAKKRKKAVSTRKVATKTGKRKTSKRKAASKTSARKAAKKSAKRAPKKAAKKAAKKAVKRAVKSSKAVKKAGKKKAASRKATKKAAGRKKAAKLGSRDSAGRRRKAKGERRKAAPRKRPAKKRVAKAKKRVAAKRPKKQVLKRPHGRIIVISKFDKDQYDEGEGLFDERRMIVSHANTASNDQFSEAFYKYFENFALGQNVADYDEIDIYRYGILIKVVGDYSRVRVQAFIKIARKILERLLPEDWTAHIVDEVDSLSIRIGMGHYTETTSLTYAFDEMEENHKRLVKLITAFDESMDEIHWFAFADVDLSWDRNTP